MINIDAASISKMNHATMNHVIDVMNQGQIDSNLSISAWVYLPGTVSKRRVIRFPGSDTIPTQFMCLNKMKQSQIETPIL